uniref:NifU_N domain-containing protein n=1 Tax=Macrostomum lignano TaxID=282301 RepID=A0A1I8FIK2_9PLAT
LTGSATEPVDSTRCWLACVRRTVACREHRCVSVRCSSGWIARDQQQHNTAVKRKLKLITCCRHCQPLCTRQKHVAGCYTGAAGLRCGPRLQPTSRRSGRGLLSPAARRTRLRSPPLPSLRLESSLICRQAGAPFNYPSSQPSLPLPTPAQSRPMRCCSKLSVRLWAACVTQCALTPSRVCERCEPIRPAPFNASVPECARTCWQRRAYFAAVHCDDVHLGRYANENFYPDVHKLRPAAQFWEECAPMLAARGWALHGRGRRRLYVCAAARLNAANNALPVLQCEQYNAEADQWTIVSRCRCRTRRPARGCGRHVYVLGGFNVHTRLGSGWCAGWIWTRIKPSMSALCFRTLSLAVTASAHPGWPRVPPTTKNVLDHYENPRNGGLAGQGQQAASAPALVGLPPCGDVIEAADRDALTIMGRIVDAKVFKTFGCRLRHRQQQPSQPSGSRASLWTRPPGSRNSEIAQELRLRRKSSCTAPNAIKAALKDFKVKNADEAESDGEVTLRVAPADLPLPSLAPHHQQQKQQRRPRPCRGAGLESLIIDVLLHFRVSRCSRSALADGVATLSRAGRLSPNTDIVWISTNVDGAGLQVVDVELLSRTSTTLVSELAGSRRGSRLAAEPGSPVSSAAGPQAMRKPAMACRAVFAGAPADSDYIVALLLPLGWPLASAPRPVQQGATSVAHHPGAHGELVASNLSLLAAPGAEQVFQHLHQRWQMSMHSCSYSIKGEFDQHARGGPGCAGATSSVSWVVAAQLLLQPARCSSEFVRDADRRRAERETKKDRNFKTSKFVFLFFGNESSRND